MKSLHIIINGEVRGGNFQSWVSKKAENLGLTGYVRNVADHEAEIIAQGDESTFDEFKRLVAEEAPIPDDQKVEARIIDHDKSYKDFELRG